MKWTKNVIVLSVILICMCGDVYAARDSYLYITSPYATTSAYRYIIDGNATDNSGLTEVRFATGQTITKGSQRGIGKVVYNRGGQSYTANAFLPFSDPNAEVIALATGYAFDATASAGLDGVHATSAHPSLSGRMYLIGHDGDGGLSLIISKPLIRGCAIGDAAGLYVVAAGADGGTRYHSIRDGDVQLSFDEAAAVASTENGALYYMNGVGTIYIDESGNQTLIPGSGGGMGISAVIEGGALVNIGGKAYRFRDADQSITPINDPNAMTAVVAVGNDALLQMDDGKFYRYDAKQDNLAEFWTSTDMIGGASAGDFALIACTNGKSYWVKDAGSTEDFVVWQYWSNTNFGFDDAVGGYLDCAGGELSEADLDGDCDVDMSDLLLYVGDWLKGV